MPHLEIVDDICSDDCRGKTRYCTLKEIIKHSGLSDKALEQLKCVEMFKWQESMREGKDIGWTESHKRWVEFGYATIFAEVYKDGMTNKNLYAMIMSEVIPPAQV